MNIMNEADLAVATPDDVETYIMSMLGELSEMAARHALPNLAQDLDTIRQSQKARRKVKRED